MAGYGRNVTYYSLDNVLHTCTQKNLDDIYSAFLIIYRKAYICFWEKCPNKMLGVKVTKKDIKI